MMRMKKTFFKQSKKLFYLTLKEIIIQTLRKKSSKMDRSILDNTILKKIVKKVKEFIFIFKEIYMEENGRMIS
jgi:hypothetical protein